MHLLLRDLFQQPTVAAVAEAVRRRQQRSAAGADDAGLRSVLDGLSEAEIDALLRQGGT